MNHQLTSLTDHETGAEVRGVNLTQSVSDATRDLRFDVAQQMPVWQPGAKT